MLTCSFFFVTFACSQKKPQKVALLFEDEEDYDDEGALFDTKPAVKTNTKPPAKVSPPSHFSMCFITDFTKR